MHCLAPQTAQAVGVRHVFKPGPADSVQSNRDCNIACYSASCLDMIFSVLAAVGHFCHGAAWRGGGRDQPTAQQLKQHQQEYEQALVIDGSDGSDCWPLEFWPLGSRALSPASYGSSSDCLADALVSTLQRYCSDGCCGDALDAAVECVPWPPLAGGDSSASQAPLPAQQQQQSHELQSGGSHSGSGTTVGTSVDWQQLLESWAVPCSAPAVVPPPLEALLAEEDAPPLPQPGQAPPAPQQQRRQSPRSRRVASAPAAQSARTFRTRQSTAGNAPALQPRPTAPARASSATAAPASSAAASPASAAAHSSPPSQQQPSLNMQAHPVLRPLVVLAQQPGPRKRGRPRVYDTITPGAWLPCASFLHLYEPGTLSRHEHWVP